MNCTAALIEIRCRSLARELPFPGEGAETEPGLHRGCELRASRQHHPTFRDSGAHAIEAEPDRRHGPQVCRYVEVNIKARINLAEVDASDGIDDQPPAPLRRRQIRIDDLHDA